MSAAASGARATRSRALEAALREGGGAERIAKQHAQGKLTARERVAAAAATPARRSSRSASSSRTTSTTAGAGRRRRHGRRAGRTGARCVVVANDATVKAGSWWPETITKILRAQEIAMRCRIPIIYLVDSAGVNLPYQGGVFPGQYGAARIFYYNSIMRRYLRIPQIAAVMGQCIAGGAYLPALVDVILMVKGTSFMGLGGPNLVKGATGQTVDGETLGGALDAHRGERRRALRRGRRRSLPRQDPRARRAAAAPPPRGAARPDAPRPAPTRRRSTSCCRAIIACRTTCTTCSRAVLDDGALDEFQPNLAQGDDLRRRARSRASRSA